MNHCSARRLLIWSLEIDPKFSRFRLEFEHKVAVVTMIRSEKKNALDMTTIEELATICRFLNSNCEINVTILTGENGVFWLVVTLLHGVNFRLINFPIPG